MDTGGEIMTGTMKPQGGVLPPDYSPLSFVMEQVENVVELTGAILEFVVDNPVLCFLLAAGFVSVGIGVFGKLKKVAK